VVFFESAYGLFKSIGGLGVGFTRVFTILYFVVFLVTLFLLLKFGSLVFCFKDWAFCLYSFLFVCFIKSYLVLVLLPSKGNGSLSVSKVAQKGNETKP
jgi:hypothetical protein